MISKRMVAPVLGACALFFLAGASCKKESKATTDQGAIAAADRAGGGAAGGTPNLTPPKETDTTPIDGVDTSRLEDDQKKLFFRLVDTFSSPCGKAHSLRTSIKDDKDCKRAPYAARYLAALIEDEAPEADVRKLWERKYKRDPGARPKEFKLDDSVPHSNNFDAPVKIVEFYDYGCPACQMVKPAIDEVAVENSRRVVIAYKQFPLVDRHPDSMSAAQAAIAAHRQGQFKKMHDMLFARSPKHKRADVLGYARDLGLDMAKFEADYDAARAQIDADLAEGDAAGVPGTPSIFVNGFQYEGPPLAKYFNLWIEEELAVNRPVQ